ncbi:MAG TPA: DUF2336 domain-containing protein [Rhodospirillaceae bacterium]|nr:DUF2336 domain-containing protein [Rhodospirillaceae bacterium]
MLENLDYEAARQRAASPEVSIRRDLAATESVPAEILYFLAEDADPSVRMAVAANIACPAKGNLLLADDPDPAVRTALAAKIGSLGLPRKGGVAATVLDHLTRDRIAAVRAIIAEALKDIAEADPALIRRLARDAEIIVAAPVLECSPVLTDLDLLDIIAGNPVQGALSAISRRAYVGTEVTGAIVASNDSHAITHLLKNANAHLQESVLDLLIEKSVHEPNWQEPLVYRPELNQRSTLRLAELVAVHLLDRILARKDLAPETVKAVAKVVGERLRQQAELPEPLSDSIEDRYAARLEKARLGHKNGQLDEISLMVILLTDQTEDLIAALAVRSDLTVTSVLDMIEAQSPRAICALAWAAGLSAVFAVELQVRLAGLPLEKVVRPADDGGFAVKEADLRWQLAMFGGKEV